MVRLSFRICAWTILLTLRLGCCVDCLEPRKQRPSIQTDRQPRRLSRLQDLERGSTASLPTRFKMEVRTVNASQPERQNLRKKRSCLGGSSSRLQNVSASLNNVNSVVDKSRSTQVAGKFSQTKETFALPIILMSSSGSPSSENVTEFINSLQRGNPLTRDNSTAVPPSTSSWPKVTLAQSTDRTSASSSISTYERELDELFGIVHSGLELMVGSSSTDRSTLQDHPDLGNGGNVSSQERTLLNIVGPEILNDPDSIAERNSQEFNHLRVKRDKLLSKANYPLREDLQPNSSHLHDLSFSFPTRSETSYNDPPNQVDSSVQSEGRKVGSVPESRLPVLPANEIMKSEGANSNSKNTENSVKSRNALNDVFPDVMNHLKSPMRMVEFIRKRRQVPVSNNFLGNRSSYHEVLDDSYPEDDKVIESMLSKVNYNALGRNSLARASRLQLQGNWATGKRGKKRRTSPLSLASRSKKKAAKSKHNNKSDAKKKRKTFLRDVPGRLMRDSRDVPNFLLGVSNDYLQVEPKIEKRNSSDSALEMDPVKDNLKMYFRKRRADKMDDKTAMISKKDQSIVSPHGGRREEESFEEEQDEDLLQGYESNLDQSEDERRRVKRHEDDAEETSKRRSKEIEELQYYEDIYEPDAAPRHEASFAKRRRRQRSGRAAKSVEQIKELVEKLVAKVAELQKYVSNDDGSRNKVESKKASGSSLKDEPKDEPRVLVHSTSMLDGSNSSEKKTNGKVGFQKTQEQEVRHDSVGRIHKDRTTLKGFTTMRAMAAARRRGSGRARGKRTSHRKWDRWTDWSSCSVTCGKGRQIRWRHCIHDCTTAETEMEEKACQLPACSPGKFLGIF